MNHLRTDDLRRANDAMFSHFDCSSRFLGGNNLETEGARRSLARKCVSAFCVFETFLKSHYYLEGSDVLRFCR